MGKAAIVTGASSGLGAAIARALRAAGARTAGIARSEPVDTVGLDLFVRGSVEDPAQCERFIAATIDRFGRIDIVVNNAAITTDPFVQRIEASDPDEVRRVMQVNYEGAFHICRAAMPHMIEAGSGVVINIASMNAVLSPAGTAAYNASKAALVALTRTLAVEGVENGIRANAILLGGTRTEMAARAIISRYERQHAVRLTDPAAIDRLLAHLADPTAVAGAIALLCRDDAAPITGSEIAINAAMTAGRALTLAAVRPRDPLPAA